MASLDLARAEWEGVASALEGLLLSVGLRMSLPGVLGKSGSKPRNWPVELDKIQRWQCITAIFPSRTIKLERRKRAHG
jgi:hypothetical protein